MEKIEATIASICKDLFGVSIDPGLKRTDEQFGDYSSNVAMQLATKLNKNPKEIAGSLREQLVRHASQQIKDVSVAGPGFLNITLTDQALYSLASNEPAKTLTGKVVVVEYSDPNPFKVLHAGHLYTTIVGDVIAKLLESAGATVHRLNYGGDVGRHVGITMWAIIKYLGGEDPSKLDAVDADSRLEWLSSRYVEGTQAFESDALAKQQITDMNKKVYQLHSDNDHDSPFAQIYWTARRWSYDGFDKLYDQLSIDKFEKYIPESEVTALGIEMVNKGLGQGVFEKSDGAVVYKGEEKGLHTRVFINSAGLPTYEAKDLGLAAKKWQDYKFDLGIIITANDIVEYMKVVLKALEHFYPEIVHRSKHLTHGVIKLPGGVKMSSRKGNILRAVDILDAARKASKKLSDKEEPSTVLAAVKYAFLKQRTGGDIIYDPEESVSVQGKSGPYLQYAHARAHSILIKAQLDTKQPASSELQPAERSLLRKISEYSEVVDKAVHELMPHHIATYLYELAQKFNSFYEDNRVIDDDRQQLRLGLVNKYAEVLKAGLNLLGISAPDKM